MEVFLKNLATWLDKTASNIWTIMVPVLFGVGLLLTIKIGFIQFRKLGTAFRVMFSRSSRKGGGEGDVSPFAAVSTALAATVGNGNIAGIATALYWGGPGAIFWMWICGFLGMATKFSEAFLGVLYREKHPDGTIAGGPMYYIKNGLNKSNFAVFLAGFFAVCGVFASLFGTGNMMQSNQMSLAFKTQFGISPFITGTVITFFVGLVVIGGIKRIGAVAERLVPTMIVLYILAGIIVLFDNIEAIPKAFLLIFEHAFSPAAATGGFLGATIKQAVQFGARRGILSNEAGLGSAPIAHAAAQTPSPLHQGLIGVMEVFIDTILVCTFTALINLSSGVWTSGVSGSAMTVTAFSKTMPHIGGIIVSLCSFFFGYTTLIGWCYYGEQCLKYLFGFKVAMPYRIVFIALTFIGSVVSIEIVFFMGDIANAFMAFPNLIGLMLLSGVLSKRLKEMKEKYPNLLD